jgi:acetylornithine deacetylase/succinyl-diaminopimelate desuccinylase-like protein
MRLAALLICLPLLGQSPAQSPIRSWRIAHEHEVLKEFADLLRLPNVSLNLADVAKNATAIQQMYRRHGVELQLLEVPGSAPALFGELKSPGATKTVVFYAHYDGQPIDATQWINKSPFTPEMRDASGKLLPWPALGTKLDPEWRLYARSAGDDKAPIIAFAAALDALTASGRAPGVNIKFFFDGEEELGSPHLQAILEKYKLLLASDGWLFCDSPIHQSRKQQLVFGARTGIDLTLTVYGAKTELHAGHYGNWAPNPALMLAQLISSIKNEDGHVRIQGFYDDVAPLGAAEREALRQLPDVDPSLRDELAIGAVEVPGRRIEEAITQPGFTVRNFTSGGAGGVIPATATARFRVDLVKGMDPAKTLERIQAHLKRQGYTMLDREPTDADRRAASKLIRVQATRLERPVRTPMNAPFAMMTIAALEAARGPVFKQPNMGGALPLTPIDEVLGAPVIIVPIANHDDNQHTHNENLRLQNLWDGIETMAALMLMK